MKFLILWVTLCIFPIVSLSAQQEDSSETLRNMISAAESTYDAILDLTKDVNQPELKKRMETALVNAVGIYNVFLEQVDSLTADIQDPLELYIEKIKLGQALTVLLDKKFKDAEDRIKKAQTLSDYRYFWFERVLFVFLRSKVQIFNYYTTQENRSIYSKADNFMKKANQSYTAYNNDILEFVQGNRALYAGNSVFSKEVYLIDDGSTGYTSNSSRVFGDLELLLEFLKGRFTDYRGLYVKFVSFRQSEAQAQKDQGILLYMTYEPIPFDSPLEQITTVDVSVTGDNLEDILTYTLNQASQLVNMKASSDKQVVSLSTQEVNYKKYIEESLLFSKVAILKAELLFKKEVKQDEKEKEKNKNKAKMLEVGLRVTVGTKPAQKGN